MERLCAHELLPAADTENDMYVCVLHIKPFFLLVDIQHAQCPRWFFILERYELCGHKPIHDIGSYYV